jgi:cytochrome c oxidase subunit 3
MFFYLYFAMTGLHAVHMIAGIGVVSVMTIQVARGRFTRVYYTPLEVTGLYWHFVDIIWIFLFPLLYLIGSRV